MKKVFARWSVVALIAACWPGWVLASSQNFVLPKHGTLLLNVPEGWKCSLKEPESARPPTIECGGKGGAAFVVEISTVWAGTSSEGIPDAKIKSMVESAAKSAEAQSVERSLALRDLAGGPGRGYYFRATDRAPKPGEWKYLTQGIIRTGGIALAFTILTNDGQAAIEKAALEMIRLAVQQGVEAV